MFTAYQNLNSRTLRRHDNRVLVSYITGSFSVLFGKVLFCSYSVFVARPNVIPKRWTINAPYPGMWKTTDHLKPHRKIIFKDTFLMLPRHRMDI